MSPFPHTEYCVYIDQSEKLGAPNTFLCVLLLQLAQYVFNRGYRGGYNLFFFVASPNLRTSNAQPLQGAACFTLQHPCPNALPTPTPLVIPISQGKPKRRRQRRSACGEGTCGVWASNDECQACTGSPRHADQSLSCGGCHQDLVETSGKRLNWTYEERTQRDEKCLPLPNRGVCGRRLVVSVRDAVAAWTRCKSGGAKWAKQEKEQKRSDSGDVGQWRLSGSFLRACCCHFL